MEDISRDLEREIAKARPKLPKKSDKQHILILSPEGKIRSGWYLRFFNRLLLLVMAICISIGLALYYMYNNMNGKNLQLVQELDDLGTTYQELLHERETLMTRLVMIQKNMKQKSKKKQIKTIPKQDPIQKAEEQPVANTVTELTQIDEENNKKQLEKDLTIEPQIVTVQKFSIERYLNTKKININFNIRNISKNGQDISGMLFALIEPKKGTYQDWVVIPKSPIKDGIPTMPEKGETFTISRFKPVRLNFETDKEISFFHKATIFVYDKNKNLIIKSIFPIDQETTSTN